MKTLYCISTSIIRIKLFNFVISFDKITDSGNTVEQLEKSIKRLTSERQNEKR